MNKALKVSLLFLGIIKVKKPGKYPIYQAEKRNPLFWLYILIGSLVVTIIEAVKIFIQCWKEAIEEK